MYDFNKFIRLLAYQNYERRGQFTKANIVVKYQQKERGPNQYAFEFIYNLASERR